jgi:hypothetical protein
MKIFLHARVVGAPLGQRRDHHLAEQPIDR